MSTAQVCTTCLLPDRDEGSTCTRPSTVVQLVVDVMLPVCSVPCMLSPTWSQAKPCSSMLWPSLDQGWPQAPSSPPHTSTTALHCWLPSLTPAIRRWRLLRRSHGEQTQPCGRSGEVHDSLRFEAATLTSQTAYCCDT